MSEFQVTIVGLGVTGTSLGLALKKASREIRIVGHDRDPEAAGAARKLGAVDRTEWNLPSACRGAGIVILALPLGAMQETLQVIGPDLTEGCLVTDTATLKVPVLAWAREAMPSHASFVGGSPTGARGRATEPSADLFKGSTYCLCPDTTTPPDAVDRASDLALAVGATPHYLDAAEHDGLVANVEQLPSLLALAALQAASSGSGWRDMTKVGGGHFEQLLATLNSNLDLDLDAAAANDGNVQRCLDDMQQALDSLRALLSAPPKERKQAVERLSAARAEWGRRGSEAQPEPLPQVGFSLRRLFWFPRQRST